MVRGFDSGYRYEIAVERHNVESACFPWPEIGLAGAARQHNNFPLSWILVPTLPAHAHFHQMTGLIPAPHIIALEAA